MNDRFIWKAGDVELRPPTDAELNWVGKNPDGTDHTYHHPRASTAGIVHRTMLAQLGLRDDGSGGNWVTIDGNHVLLDAGPAGGAIKQAAPVTGSGVKSASKGPAVSTADRNAILGYKADGYTSLVGQTIVDQGYMSTTWDPPSVEDWFGEEHESFNVLKLQVPAGMPAFSMDRAMSFGGKDRESELVLPRGSSVYISSVDGNVISGYVVPPSVSSAAAA